MHYKNKDRKILKKSNNSMKNRLKSDMKQILVMSTNLVNLHVIERMNQNEIIKDRYHFKEEFLNN